ncbi:MAG: ATP-binding protein [Proteobacteria bacterium]|nr:ATP-binding protein [Pseudomonadota bacterium]
MSNKVLVVDNNHFFLETIKKYLEEKGYSVTAIDDPLQALEIVKKETFNYILVDHIMPKIDGTRLCDYLKKNPQLTETPVIILTGVAIEASTRVKEIKADAYIAKSPIPNFMADVLSVIKAFDEKTDTEELKEKVVGIEKIYPREMTKELIEIETHLNQILTTMTEGIIECDNNYKIFFANNSALKFLDMQENEVIGNVFFDILRKKFNMDVENIFPPGKIIGEREIFSDNFCLTLKDKTFCVNINALKSKTVEQGILIVLEDITDLTNRINEQNIVNNFAKTLTSELELEDVIRNTVSSFKEFIICDTVIFMLFKDNEDLVVKEISGLNSKLAPNNIFNIDFLYDRCIDSPNKPYFNNKPEEIKKLIKPIVEKLGYTPTRMLCQSIKFQNQCLGVIMFLNESNDFNAFSMQLFQSLINFSSIALENALRYRKLKELNLWRQNYMANISHELRTPLTIIKGFNEILVGNMIKDEQSKSTILSNMLNEVNKLARLIDNLLTISKFEKIPTILKIKHSNVSIHEIINEAISLLSQEWESKNITFRTFFCEEEIIVDGDRDLLLQSFYHLISNAIKYSKNDSKIEVITSVNANLGYIKIRDYGIGIPPDQIDNVFEKFYMIDAGPSKTTRGTGLGLYLVREIINLHHGNIQVDSSLNRGTVFTIKLPLESETIF